MEVEGQSPSPPSKKQRRTESKAGDDGDAGALSERVSAHLAAFEAQDLDGICQSYDEESVIVRWDWSEKKVRLFGVGVGTDDSPPEHHSEISTRQREGACRGKAEVYHFHRPRPFCPTPTFSHQARRSLAPLPAPSLPYPY